MIHSKLAIVELLHYVEWMGSTGAVLIAVLILTAVMALLGVGLAIFVVRFDGKTTTKRRPSQQKDEYLDVLSGRIAAVEVTLEGYPSLWKEERERTEKHANRAQQAERDLEARLARIAESLDADGEAGPVDAHGSQLQLLPAVQEGMGDVPASDDWSDEELAFFGSV